MARSLNLEVTAEGVETAQQASFLRSLRCDLVQGYHFRAAGAGRDFLVAAPAALAGVARAQPRLRRLSPGRPPGSGA